MRGSTKTWIPVALVVVFVAGAAVGTLPRVEPDAVLAGNVKTSNDAGSGTDAGDSPLAAFVIEGGSKFYRGNLTPPTDDRDWYRLAGAPQGPAFCAEGRVTSSIPVQAALAFRSDRSSEVSQTITANTEAYLAVAHLDSEGIWLGVEPASLMLQTGTSKPGPEHYRFELRMPNVPDVDPDASSTGATVLDGPCFRGNLPAGDASDTYLLQTTSATRATFSLARDGSVAPVLEIFSPSGLPVATIRSGDIATVTLDESGWWRLVVRPDAGSATAFASAAATPPVPALRTAETSDDDYIVGVTVDGDHWCRPSCA